MKNLKTPTLLLIISLIASILETTALFFVARAIHNRLDFSLYLFSFFIFFIISFFVFYFIYNAIIFQKIEVLYHLVKSQQPKKEIPSTEFQLEEVDAITKLEEEITKLSIERQKELEHYRNLDSYRKEYLGNVSHELKTPIFNIQGYVSTLMDGGLEDPNINMEYLRRADRSVDRMINIIDDLETITQLESGALELDLERYDITAQCRDIYEQLELQASRKNIKLQFGKKYDKPIYVLADKFRIRQVFVNLITNSIKYGKENGKTEINFSLYDEQVIVEIKDNGIGIKPEHLPRLFERFYRVDKGRSREQGGTGLGLAITKHILEAHLETITVTSKVGEGTAFVFTLKRI